MENTNPKKRIAGIIAISVAGTTAITAALRANGYPQPSVKLSSSVSEAAMQAAAGEVLFATVVLMLLAISWQVAFGLGRRV